LKCRQLNHEYYQRGFVPAAKQIAVVNDSEIFSGHLPFASEVGVECFKIVVSSNVFLESNYRAFFQQLKNRNRVLHIDLVNSKESYKFVAKFLAMMEKINFRKLEMINLNQRMHYCNNVKHKKALFSCRSINNTLKHYKELTVQLRNA